jgi:hypothetical protein
MGGIWTINHVQLLFMEQETCTFGTLLELFYSLSIHHDLSEVSTGGRSYGQYYFLVVIGVPNIAVQITFSLKFCNLVVPVQLGNLVCKNSSAFKKARPKFVKTFELKLMSSKRSAVNVSCH